MALQRQKRLDRGHALGLQALLLGRDQPREVAR